MNMSSPPDQPHLVSLVLQSKKALQSGEQLCSRAHAISNASACATIDVVALDAKVRWMTEAVGEQLKLVASVAKSIEEKRASLEKQVQEWDKLREKRSTALDNVLESLSSQLIPPDFHQNASTDISPFGSPNFNDDEHKERKMNGSSDPSLSAAAAAVANHSPSSTLKGGLRGGMQKARDREKAVSRSSVTDKSLWKTLRDFVDEQAIEDVLETVENDRLELDDIMNKTEGYPETLAKTMESIRDSLPVLSPDSPMKFTEAILAAQDVTITSMAAHLESLTSHYGQMANALQESEAGEAFSEEDLHDMNRDANELPSIMAELEENADSVEDHHKELQAAKDVSQTHLSLLAHTLDDLDELGDIMLEMLQTQEEVEAKCQNGLTGLHDHLLTIEHLHDRFVSYQTAFNKLVLELARRRHYREAAENIVRGMLSQLEAMTLEETQVRSHFNAEYGAHLPEDLCLCVGNTPTRWEVVPFGGDTLEFLPVIGEDLIAQVEERMQAEPEKTPKMPDADGS